MPALVLKKIPDELHRKLKMQAEFNRRSMTSQAIFLLQQGVDAQSPASSMGFAIPPFKGKCPQTDAILAEARKAHP